MATEMEKPRVTEIKVRMDCNGCVQKIKKALHGVTGIYDIYVDFPEQKITVTGFAEHEKLVKAIKRTRRSAVICIQTEQLEEASQPTEPLEGETPGEEGAPPPPEPTNPPPENTQTQEAAAEPPQQENPPPATSQPHQPHQHARQIDEGVHIVHHYPYDHGYRHPYGQSLQQGYRGEQYQPPQPTQNTYRPSPHVTEYEHPPSPHVHPYYSRPDHYSEPAFQREPPGPPQPVYATHSYNTYKPSPYVTGYAYPHSPPRHSPYSGPGFRTEPSQPPQPLYATQNHNMYKPSPSVTEYAYHESPPRYSSYSMPNNYSRDYYSGNYENGNGNGNGNVTSMFSEENPNACRIV